MNIPEKVKIGSFVYTVKKTDCLSMGDNYTGEILYTRNVIHVRPTVQAREEADFLHECIHGILDVLGYKEHDEEQVDRFAHALHAFILDNPDIFKEGVQP